MVDFAGWEMPVYYSGILEEHRAVRTRAGLFDVSHMGEVEVRGPKALEACQRIVTNDAGKLAEGGAQYSVMCLPTGGVVDDVIYYRLAPDRYFFCVNASNEEKDFAWIREHCQRSGAEAVNRSAEFALLALQGPRAAEILRPLTPLDLDGLRGFQAADSTVAGIATLVSRTGYTGEDGFELYVDPARAEALWDELLSAGAASGIAPIGLGARDTLRLEKALMLYGNELDEATSPLEAGLGWVVKLDKGDFVGRDALVRQKAEGLRRKLVGLETTDGAPPRHGYRLFAAGEPVGVVTSGTKSPTLGKGVALGYVGPEHTAVGHALEVEIRGRMHPAKVVRLPFYQRA
jgi:aminomethyltransferase